MDTSNLKRMQFRSAQTERENKSRAVLGRVKITRGKSRNLNLNLKTFQANLWKFSLPTVWCLHTSRCPGNRFSVLYQWNWIPIVSGIRDPKSRIPDSLTWAEKKNVSKQQKQEFWIFLRITWPRYIGLRADRNLNMKSQETYLQHLWLYLSMSSKGQVLFWWRRAL